MKIYDCNGFPNPARVRIALAEKGATGKVQFVPVDVMGGEHRSPAFKAKNPGAAVPVLELDDGTAISECTAITEYIDHAFEGIPLTGKTAKERAVVHMMQRRAETGVRYFDQVLASQPFVAGDAFSMADITVFAGLAFADFAKLDIPSECSHLGAWRARMGQRPSMGG
jgi:glutathione S-transferase